MSSPTPRPMFSDGQLRALKTAVIVMGVILVVGFAVVIGRIVQLAQRAGAPNATAPVADLRSNLGLALPAGARIEHLAISGDRLAVHYTAPSESGIRVIDLSSGAERRIIVRPADQ